MREYIATFVVRTRIKLESDQRDVAMQVLNAQFTGKKHAPHFYDFNATATPEHKQAHSNVCRAYDVGLTVGVCPDGTLHVIGVHGE